MTLQPRLQVRTCETRQCPLTSEKKKKKSTYGTVCESTAGHGKQKAWTGLYSDSKLRH